MLGMLWIGHESQHRGVADFGVLQRLQCVFWVTPRLFVFRNTGKREAGF
jgi:hypothetical protein